MNDEELEPSWIEDEAETAAAVLREKLVDLQTPGFVAEFDPEEAEQAGAFVEDALSAEDALASAIDTVDLFPDEEE